MNLQGKEMERAWMSLVVFMEATPMVEPDTVVHAEQSGKWWCPHFLSLRPAMALATVFAFMITSSGLTAVAAEYADPGDLLYPVKVDVVEEMIGNVLSVSPEVQAAWEVHRIGRRLEEAGSLAASNTLGQEEALWVVERVGDRTGEVLGLALELEGDGEADDAEDVVSDLEASLHAGGRIFTYLRSQETARTRRNVALIVAELHRAEGDVTQERNELEEELSAGLREESGVLVEEIQEAQQSIEKALVRLTKVTKITQLFSEAQSKVESAKQLLAEALMSTREAKHGQAFLQASRVHRMAEEAEELLELREEVLAEW